MQKNTITLREEFDEVGASLLEQIKNIPDNNLNQGRLQGWTAGQVLDHALKSAESLSGLLHGRVGDTARDPAMHVAMIRQVFLDFTTRMQSPDFILPDNPPHQKALLFNRASAFIPVVREAIDNLDLDKTCLDFELPKMGPMTRLEWIHFIICHTRRHLHQLAEILKEQGVSTTVTGSPQSIA